MLAHLLDAANHTGHYATKHPPDVQVFSSSVNDFLDFLEAQKKHESLKERKERKIYIQKNYHFHCSGNDNQAACSAPSVPEMH